MELYKNKARFANTFVSFDGTDLYIKTKYDADNDLCIKMCKRGGNSLVDFDAVYLVANTDRVPNAVVAVGTSLLTSSTDWFAPYKVIAINTVDGDLPDGYATHFTGGNHQYNNTGSGSTATARCSSFKVFCDGIEVTNGTVYCSNVKIVWTNYVQGNNTKKADGTGREILKETICLNFNGVTFDVENFIEALEDVYVHTYYGLCNYFSPASFSVKFVGGDTRAIVSCPADANSVNNNCREIKVYNASIVVDFGVNNIDIGDFALNVDAAYSAFTVGTSKKTYFNVVRKAASNQLSGGEIYTLKGFYKFYKPY